MSDKDGTMSAIQALMELPQSPPESPTALVQSQPTNPSALSTTSRKRSQPSPFSEMAAKLHHAHPGTPQTDSLQLSSCSPIMSPESSALDQRCNASTSRSKIPKLPVMMTYMEAIPNHQLVPFYTYPNGKSTTGPRGGRDRAGAARPTRPEADGRRPQYSTVPTPSRHRITAVPINSSAAEAARYGLDPKKAQQGRGFACYPSSYYAMMPPAPPPPPEAFHPQYMSGPARKQMLMYPGTDEEELDGEPFILESFDSRQARIHASMRSPKIYRRVYVVHPDFEDTHQGDGFPHHAFHSTSLPPPSLRKHPHHHHFSMQPPVNRPPTHQPPPRNRGSDEEVKRPEYLHVKDDEEEELRQVTPSPPPSSITLQTEKNGGEARLEKECISEARSSQYLKSTTTTTMSAKKNQRQARRCSCRNSKCLKLYCDCFATSRLCKDCNCDNCHNKDEGSIERQLAIQAILEKNPRAFRDKINSTKSHASGCHCVRSRCLKKYCECFEADVHCGVRCKCRDCQNFPGSNLLMQRRDALRHAWSRDPGLHPVLPPPQFHQLQALDRC